jgi:hypothetical protein
VKPLICQAPNGMKVSILQFAKLILQKANPDKVPKSYMAQASQFEILQSLF